jgi:hypothetical protein
MRKINLRMIVAGLLFTVSALIGLPNALAQTLAEKMEANLATEHNLAEFNLIAPPLTDQEVADVRLNQELEANEAYQRLAYEEASVVPMATEMIRNHRISVEIFQNAPSVGKQFLLVRDAGRIRYVFAISGGAKGRGTPTGTFGVTMRRWRHMSGSYPSKGENNMDHVTYFKPLYGFHSTTFGLYSKLGTRDSRGCVRLARPQARAVFSLIKAHGGATIYSYATKDPHASELSVIKKMLANDLNFIQGMLRHGNKGDVPFTEAQYYQYLSGQMNINTVVDLMKRRGIKEILEVDEGRDRFPR